MTSTRFVVFCISLITAINSLAQTGVIIGRVLDSQTQEPLPFANVFINHTTIGTVTDEKGFFKLTQLPLGFSEVIFSFVGYQSYQTRINLESEQRKEMIIRLVVEEKVLENVQLQGKRDKVWSNQLKRFTKVFLGTGKTASECRITNPWVLEFGEDKSVLTARASDNLIIENKALGYEIHYTLKKFVTDGGTYTILGNVRFEEMKVPDQLIKTKWDQNRWNTYKGSQRHLFKSILNHRLRAEGFLLYNDKTGFENSPRSSVPW